MAQLVIGVSACLLGNRVRYDGKVEEVSDFLRLLGRVAKLVPYCPETGAGFPVPREAIELAGEAHAPRVETVRSHVDVTAELRKYCDETIVRLSDSPLDGYIFRRKSPSCGLERVKVRDGEGAYHSAGRGIWAASVTERLPELAVFDTGRLGERFSREVFLDRAFASAELRLNVPNATAAEMAAFTEHWSFTLAAHDPACLPAIRAAAQRGDSALWRRLLAAALTREASAATHLAVLRELPVLLRKTMSSEEEEAISAMLDAAAAGDVHTLVPAALLRRAAERSANRLLLAQSYWRTLSPLYA